MLFFVAKMFLRRFKAVVHVGEKEKVKLFARF